MLVEKERLIPIYANSQLVLQLRRALWAEMIKAEMDCSTAYEVEKSFSRPEQFVSTPDGTNHPTNWNKYLRGEQSPSKKTLLKVSKKVSRAEYWFNLPMWKVLQQPVSQEKLNQYLLETRPDISARLFTIKGSYSAELVRKKIRSHESLIKFLCLDSTIDALNAIVLLCAEIESKSQYISSIEYYYAMQEILINFCQPIPYCSYFRVLYKLIKDRFYYSWDLGHDFRGKTIGHSVKAAWEIHRIVGRLTMYLEDMCLFILSETRKANAIGYHFYRISDQQRKAVLEQISFSNKDKYLKVNDAMKELVWMALKEKLK